MALELSYRRIDRSMPGERLEWPCENADLAICECMGGGVPAAIRGPQGMQGFLIHLQLPAGSVMLHDLQDEPDLAAAAATQGIIFFLSRAALHGVAERVGGCWHDALQTGTVARDPVIHHLALCILPELTGGASSRAPFVQHIAQALIVHVLATYGKRSSPDAVRGGLARWQVRRAKDMLGSDLMRRSDLSDVARECGLSLSHFSRSFRQTVGDTPHGWLIRHRLERAQAMLRESATPLAEIALTCGFADQSHFTRLFSREIGVSPGAWRRAPRSRPVSPYRELGG